MGLNYIISTIRQEIDEKNVDLEKYFKKFGLDKNKEIGYICINIDLMSIQG